VRIRRLPFDLASEPQDAAGPAPERPLRVAATGLLRGAEGLSSDRAGVNG
jgi:hypothetical protein